MMLDALDLLIIFVAFARYKYDVAGIGQSGSRADGFAAVDYAEGFLASLQVKSGFHVMKYLGRILVTRIVGGEDEPVAAQSGFLGHDRALAFVAVASGAYHGDYGAACAYHLAYGLKARTLL